MFCTQCGAEIEDDSRFCIVCGARVQVGDMTDAESENTDMEDRKNEVSVDSSVLQDESDNNEMNFPANGQDNPTIIPPDYLVEPGKRREIGIIAGVITVAGIVAAAWGVPKIIKQLGSTNNSLVYLSEDNDYNLIKKIQGKKTEFVEMARAKIEDYEYYSPLVKFSPNDKYIYYFTKYNSEDLSGTLNRVEYKNLKKGSSKNEKYIEVIDSNVQNYNLTCIDDERIVYISDDNSLYYFDGKESQLIKKNINTFLADDKGNIVFTIGTYDDGYSLYGTTVDDISQIEKLATDYYRIYDYDDSTDLTRILFSRMNDDKTVSLYTTGVGQETTKIASHATIEWYGNDSEVYYTEYNGDTFNIYDCIEDDCLESDQDILAADTSNYVTEADWAEYRAAEERMSVRDGLQEQIELKTLYCYENGTITAVSDGVGGVEYDLGVPVFVDVNSLKQEKQGRSYNIHDFDNDVDEAFIEWIKTNERLYHIGPMDGVEDCSLSFECMEKLGNYINEYQDYKDDIITTYAGDSLYIQISDQVIFVGNIVNGVVDDFTAIYDAYIVGKDGDTLYYAKDAYAGKRGTYSDLYSCCDGDSKCLAKDIFSYYARVYSDHVILAYTDNNASSGYDLTMINENGEKTFIADAVTEYYRLADSKIVYISDDDLYVYDGKEKNRIADGVTYVWIDEPMESTYLYAWGEGGC